MEAFEELNAYLSATETMEQISELLRVNKHKNYSAVHQLLKVSINKTEIMISAEEATSTLLVPLTQHKQMLDMLLNMTRRLIQEQNSSNNAAKPTYNARNSNEQSDVLEQTLETPKVKGLDDIIGLQDVKKTLRSLIILPKCQPQLFYNRRICNSILLYGAPGTGKTRLAHAIAAESRAIFHCISAADILSQYVGQTERTIKSLFGRLKQSCEFTILFIDEIDALCRKRTSSEQEHTRRIKTELMCQISKIEDCGNMFMICATNCPWDLDTAILRRFQKRMYIPLPDQFERLQFFQFFTKDVDFADEVLNWTELVHKTGGYSGSDLADLVQNALDMPLNELESTIIWKDCNGFYEPAVDVQVVENRVRVTCCELGDLPAQSVKARKLQMKDLLVAADRARRTVPQSDIKKFEAFNRT